MFGRKSPAGKAWVEAASRALASAGMRGLLANLRQSYRREGMMIGSGPVEAACQVIVGQRLKGAGMRWSKGGADAVLAGADHPPEPASRATGVVRTRRLSTLPTLGRHTPTYRLPRESPGSYRPMFGQYGAPTFQTAGFFPRLWQSYCQKLWMRPSKLTFRQGSGGGVSRVAEGTIFPPLNGTPSQTKHTR